MKRFISLLAVLLLATLVLSACAAGNIQSGGGHADRHRKGNGRSPGAGAPKQPAGQELIVYMQMGGNPGDASTLARTNGAKAAAKALGIKLIEQYSGWDSQKMIDQFKEAIAAKPDGIVIMGHPGEAAMGPLVDQADGLGIIVTSGNNPLPNIEKPNTRPRDSDMQAPTFMPAAI